MSDLIGVGDEVICVNDSRPEGWSSEVFPQWVIEDSKYIISELLENDDIVVGCLVRELSNPPIFQKLLGRVQEPAFATWRFVKLRSAYEIKEEMESEIRVKYKGKLKEKEEVEEFVDRHSQYLSLIDKKKY
jgi:hypothetical protein